MDDDEEADPGFQVAADAVCIQGGTYSLASHGEVKRLSWVVFTAQPTVAEQRPLRWSHGPITFDAADHPDRNAGVGLLPLVVSPTINNVTVSKMLVDGGAGLNLISARLMEKLQITHGPVPGREPWNNEVAWQDHVASHLGNQGQLSHRECNVRHRRYSSPVQRLPWQSRVGQVYGRNPPRVQCTQDAIYVGSADHQGRHQGFMAVAAMAPGDINDHEPGSPDPAPPVKKARVDQAPPAEGGVARGPILKKAQLKGEAQMTKKVPLNGDATHFVTIGAKIYDK